MSNKEEPIPVKTNGEAVWDMVMRDFKERNEIGKRKYDTYLQCFNGRDALIDAYQEMMDLIVYAKQKIVEEAVLQRAAEILVADVESEYYMDNSIRKNILDFLKSYIIKEDFNGVLDKLCKKYMTTRD